MVTDGQVSELRRWLAAWQVARRFCQDGFDGQENRTILSRRSATLPSQRKSPARAYRTRTDPFADVWTDCGAAAPSRAAAQSDDSCSMTCSDSIPARFADSTRRTFERRVATGERSTDRTRRSSFRRIITPVGSPRATSPFAIELGVKIAGATFEHTLFHCVLTYSNVESVSLCFSESFEALSEGIQKRSGSSVACRAASHRLAQRGRSKSLRSNDADDSLRGADGALRLCRPKDQCPVRQRERRCRITKRTLKDRIDQALAASRKSRLRQS